MNNEWLGYHRCIDCHLKIVKFIPRYSLSQSAAVCKSEFQHYQWLEVVVCYRVVQKTNCFWELNSDYRIFMSVHLNILCLNLHYTWSMLNLTKTQWRVFDSLDKIMKFLTISHDFLQLTVTKLSVLRNSLVFGPHCKLTRQLDAAKKKQETQWKQIVRMTLQWQSLLVTPFLCMKCNLPMHWYWCYMYILM